MNGFVEISKYAGMREDLVQAGGGNTSFKENAHKMYIKASGYQLSEVTREEGFSIVNPQIIQDAFMNEQNLDDISKERSDKILEEGFIEGKRPSIETFLHAVSGRYTLHTHPIVVNAMTCRKNGMDELEKMFPEALIVSYATPGVDLAKRYFGAYREKLKGNNYQCDVVFLQNHGLVVSGNTAAEVIQKNEEILKKLEEYLDADMRQYRACTEIWKAFKEKMVWKVTDYHVLFAYQEKNELWEYQFCPDCVVFLGKKALNMGDTVNEKQVKDFQCEYGMPTVVVFKNDLYILADSVKKAMEIQSVLSFSAQVMRLNRSMPCNMLDEKEQNFLLNWDAEKYRKNMK